MPQLELIPVPPDQPPEARRKPKGEEAAPAGQGSGGSAGVVEGDLAEHARRKYLNYALSVITARAIPDVRDGLKPVQRRILFTMFNDLRLTHDARHRKSAKVVGDVIGKYHPHGDTAVYDAMVRMAQAFNMRMPLVDGQGNFGSIDGDSAAAYRYTEAKLTALSSELLEELKRDTVHFRPTFDGTGNEPIVLPARFPNILVNGATGIAVGMATAIPPHNLGEVVRASLMLIDDPEATVAKLMGKLKGPDFPTGGQLVASRTELRQAYEQGKSTFKLRGSWTFEEGKPADGRGSKKKAGRNPMIVITEVPWGVEKSALVEEIGQIILGKKLPMVIGVQDLSTEDIRVEIELDPKVEVDPELVMAYLFKHTRLQTTVKLDLTVLVPTANPEVSAPARLDLKSILREFLDFRLLTVRRRFEYDLRKLEERIHILEGFEKIFDALDRAIKLIRGSDGRQDAAKKLIKAFDLDQIQADAILETRLYKLAKLEILKIREELEDKRKQAKKIRAILKSEAKLWKVVKDELEALVAEFGDRRRTRIDAEDLTEEFSAESFIIEEDAMVLVTRDGWIKRQRSVNLESTRMRDGDAPLALLGGSTRESVVLFSNRGSAYVLRINDVPASSGHGTPIQQLFKFKDGEKVIGAATTDSRFMPEFAAAEKPDLGEEYEEPYPHFLAVSKGGLALRFTLWPHREPSTRNGRLFGKLKSGDEFVDVFQVYAEDDVCALSRKGKLLCCNVMDINLLAGPGRGVTMIKLEAKDEVLACWKAKTTVEIQKSSGGTIKISAAKATVTNRGGKGRPIMKRGSVEAVSAPLPETPDFEAGAARLVELGLVESE
ncbi:DNA topoisomerase IV subunit A [Pseudenhygromyxa sp. WMMC2535]|uniref:DNA gyrase/topoisomerase IV subunit A n=1 Tax=Pseudenhygromyxa sp. WMMC2535 TaxID=2712867 RepID=UPI001556E1F6|nr:DNA topoisomerase IV subunit A [Pseudenhygromyxa sp. WMMC2535]NVB36209.1 DNA topoisomerase IV subunit A [Pseudenhygromyxa sp. WMMC2535]NVB43408.1 DNA topoisomerase IV subunit A [Pseudenhygromyxa sp. WMMC2535]